jgi:hypothetical protein
MEGLKSLPGNDFFADVTMDFGRTTMALMAKTRSMSLMVRAVLIGKRVIGSILRVF